MPEGLSAQEVGKEIAEHAKPNGHDDAQERRDRLVSIAEAVLLSIVALMAAWSGYAAAKWEHRVARWPGRGLGGEDGGEPSQS
jgi:hypothetical protein